MGVLSLPFVTGARRGRTPAWRTSEIWPQSHL